MGDWELRKFDNFVEVFKVPANGDEWSKRVVNNLKYYRANYALIAIVISLFTL